MSGYSFGVPDILVFGDGEYSYEPALNIKSYSWDMRFGRVIQFIVFSITTSSFTSSSSLPELLQAEGFGLDKMLVIALYRSQHGLLE